MLQALSFRPEMEPTAAAVGVHHSVVTFRKARSGRPRDSNMVRSIVAHPANACFCEEMEGRQ